MIPQRARGAESRVKVQIIKWTAEGAVKCVRSTQSILQRLGTRQLPGICWYPAKRTTSGREFKVAPRIMFIRP